MVDVDLSAYYLHKMQGYQSTNWHLVNVGRSHTTIKPGQKLTQFILIPVSYMDVHVLEELPDRNTERGAGGFGSTGL